MIVKVAKGRRDGKSSFKRLSDYLTEGIIQSGESPLKTSWERLTQYITQESVLNALGDNVDKTVAVELGNLNSLQTAALEMQAVAAQNTRQKDPVYHYILSWPEGERPATKDILAAARHTIKALGMDQHQYIIAVHANTDNIHAHIEVNRIHPQTYKAARLEWAHATLHKAAREAEIEFGWSHDNGIYQVAIVNGAKHIVRNKDFIDDDLVPARNAANRYETWNGEQSLETWCKGEPADELKAVLKAKNTASWQDIHRVLARYGLELRDSGGGGMKVFDVSADSPEKQDKPLVVSASKAFRFMKRADLEERFGAFEAKAADLDLSEPKRTYKRDPQKRLDRRLERQALRDALRDRYMKEMQAARTHREMAQKEIAATFGNDDKTRFTSITTDYLAKRKSIRQGELRPEQKQQAYMLAKLTMLKAMEQLKAQVREEKQQRRALLPSLPSWRLWVEQQAQLGDEAAISALRGMIYQEKRDGKAKADLEDEENYIAPANAINSDPYVRALQNMVWKVAKNGRVSYSFKNGEAAFVDDGSRLLFGRKDVNDEALMVTLRYAADKWDGQLRLNGGDAAFKQRMVRMAVELGIEVKNLELRGMQKQVRDELAHVKKSAPPAAATPATRKKPDVDIETLLQKRNDKAVVHHAVTQANTYSGRIVAQNNRYIAQHIGKNDFILHEKSAFKDGAPVVGRTVKIQYKSGHAVAQAKTPRGRGGK